MNIPQKFIDLARILGLEATSSTGDDELLSLSYSIIVRLFSSTAFLTHGDESKEAVARVAIWNGMTDYIRRKRYEEQKGLSGGYEFARMARSDSFDTYAFIATLPPVLHRLAELKLVYNYSNAKIQRELLWTKDKLTMMLRALLHTLS